MNKTCLDCQNEYPATMEYFYLNPRLTDGFMPSCKPCYRAYSRERMRERRVIQREHAVDQHDAQYLSRHLLKRLQEREIEDELLRKEPRAYVEPLSFTQVSLNYFRGQSVSRKWRIA